MKYLKKIILLIYIHIFKSVLINNMDRMRILATKSSSVILRKAKYLKVEKLLPYLQT